VTVEIVETEGSDADAYVTGEAARIALRRRFEDVVPAGDGQPLFTPSNRRPGWDSATREGAD